MTDGPPATSPCPKCGAAIGPAPPPAPTEIRGGVPTAVEIESTARTWAERRKWYRTADGPVRCGACGETLYRMGGLVLVHRGAPPVLGMAQAADKLRNHLRRLAITRLGRIEGDCYLLPFARVEGRLPDSTADETFLVLGASIAEERLEQPFLPAADLKPFEAPPEGAAGSSGAQAAVLRVIPPSLGEAALRARAEVHGCRVSRALEWIHYPMWLMRVEDCGKIEGAWMDGIEGKFIRHRMRLAPPVPSSKSVAAWTAAPAAVSLAAAAASASIGSLAAAAAGAAAWAASAPLLHAALLRRWRG